MNKLFFDIDGTLWDSRERLYRLYGDLSGDPISFDNYWAAKRRKVSNEELLRKYLGCDDKRRIEDFTSSWMSKIESEQYLKLDIPFDFTRSTLTYFRERKFEIYYVTLRQSRAAVIKELESNNLYEFCDACLVSEGRKDKAELVRASGIYVGHDDFFVGDTGMDINAGKALGARTVGVLSGFRDKEVLSTYNPDYILDNISYLHEIIS